uniref:Uncharacterized protein n=1 Tax=Timema bartmani TaxID=61472 RepID=A0A7R9F6S2_9NEOP|nr:unnamed protein product [Timema bartmani]
MGLGWGGEWLADAWPLGDDSEVVKETVYLGQVDKSATSKHLKSRGITYKDVRYKWKLAAVMPTEELIPAEALKDHTECIYSGS